MDSRSYNTKDDVRYISSEDKSPTVKVQNYFSEEKQRKSKTSNCCMVCKANCEFVALLIVCILVWVLCLSLYVHCEIGKTQQINLNMTNNANNSSKEGEIGSRDMKGQSWNNSSNPFVSLTTPVTPLENTTNIQRSYFPQKLKTSADPGSVMSVTNSVSDCKLFLVWLSIFSGGLSLFGLVGVFCCCSQM